MRKIVTGLVLIALLVGLLAACGGESTAKDPMATAQAFLTAMGNRGTSPDTYYKDAYKLLSLDTQATVSESDFKAMLDTAWKTAGITGFQVKTVKPAILSTSEFRASVPYQATLTTAEGETDVFNALSLVKENNEWRVVWPPAR